MASKRNLRRKNCESKKQFASRTEAFRTIRWMQHKEPDNDWLNAYVCRYCGAWHIGHLPGHIRLQLIERRKELLECWNGS